MVGPGAQAGQFIAVGVGVPLGALGPGPQVGPQLLPVAGRLGAEPGQHFLRIGADPARLGAGGLGGGLGPGRVAASRPGGLFCLLGPGQSLVPGALGGADELAGLGAGRLDRRVPAGLGGRDPRVARILRLSQIFRTNSNR